MHPEPMFQLSNCCHGNGLGNRFLCLNLVRSLQLMTQSNQYGQNKQSQSEIEIQVMIEFSIGS